MKRSITIGGNGIAFLLLSISLLSGCKNNDFDLNKVKTDSVTLFSDSLIIPLGSTKAIMMSEIITDDVLKELGLQKENGGYSFNFKSNEKIDLDFSLKDDITINAPILPSDRLVDTHFGNFTLDGLNVNNTVTKKIAEGTIDVVLSPGGDPTDIADYEYEYVPKSGSARMKKVSKLSLPRIGQSISLFEETRKINVNVEYGTAVEDVFLNLPSGVPVEKFFSFQINNSTGGIFTISVSNENSVQVIKDLGSTYSGLRVIFPKEFVVAGDGVILDTQLNRYCKYLSADGSLSVNLLRIEYGDTGLVPAVSGDTEMKFEFGYDGTLLINRPPTMQELVLLQNDSKAELDLTGTLSQTSITALSAKTKQRSEPLTIADTEINLGSFEVPEMIKSISALSIQPVCINLNVGRLVVSGLSFPTPHINGLLYFEMPDFCRIENKTIGTDGKWVFTFTDLVANGFTVPILIDRIANIPPVSNGRITFANTKIKVSGLVNIPSIELQNVSSITTSPLSLRTVYADGVVANKLTLSQIEGMVQSQGSYKIELDMLAELREGSGNQSVKLENVSFKNPNLALNFGHTLPCDFKASMLLTPYIANEVKGTPVNIETTFKSGINQTTVVNSITEADINGLIRELPDSVVVGYKMYSGTSVAPMQMNIGDMKTINFSALYNVGLPLSFGFGMKISTDGTTELTLGQEFANTLFGSEKNKIILMVTAENSIPMSLSVQMIPLDKEGKVIEGISISSFIVGGGSLVNDRPVSAISKFNVEIKGSKEAVSQLSKLKYVVSASPSDVNGATVRQDCQLKMGMKLKLLGGIKVAL